MKIQHLIIAAFLLIGYLCNAQLYIINSDKTTHGKMEKINASNLTTAGANTAMILAVPKAEDDMETKYDYEYQRNSYDARSDFIAGTALKVAMAIGADILAGRFNDANTPYLSENKKTYMDKVNKNSLNLLYMQSLSTRNIRSSSRQEIYRTRRNILRTFSKDEKHMRKLLLLAAAAYGFQSETELLEALQAGEIIF